MGTNVITDNTASHEFSKSTPYPEAGQAKVSSLTVGVTSVAADLTLNGSHDVVLVDTTAAVRTITLPAAASYKGMLYTIVRITAGANAVTVDGNASETINAVANYSLSAQWKHVTVVSDGANWVIINAN
jgi:hypothetical protein